MKSEVSITGTRSYLNLISLKTYAIILPAAFLLGRVQLIKGLLPFGLPMYIAAYELNVSRFAVAALILTGMATAGGGHNIFLTALGIILFSLLNAAFKAAFKDKNSAKNRTASRDKMAAKDRFAGKEQAAAKNSLRSAVLGVISILIPNFVYVSIRGMLLYELLMAFFQAFIVFVIVFIIKKSFVLIDETRLGNSFTNEELISIAITGALVLSGFGDVKIFGFGLKNVICIFTILMFSFRCGSAAGATVGVVAGLILSMSSTMAPLIIGCYAFCGLLSGVFRNLGKVGTSLGFFMGNTVLTLYLNGSIEALIYLKEIILAVAIFMIIPQKFILKIPESFGASPNTSMNEAIFSLRSKDVIVEKLNKFSRTFMEVSKTFNEISPVKAVVNKHDVSTMLDRVADRICKDCSLCLHCWDKNFYSTYQVMFKLVEKLEHKGFIEADDIPGYFISRCERINDFITIVNNMYEIFKVDMMWKNRLGENRSLVSKQLEELSKAISGLAEEIEYDTGFKTEVENTLVYMLKREGIKDAQVLAFENKHGKYEVSISYKGCEGEKKCTNIINKIVSDVIGRKMIRDSFGCNKTISAYSNNININNININNTNSNNINSYNNCVLRFIEEETYSITTGVAYVSKYDERYESMVNGDNYTFINAKDGKFVTALSDGMGSGEKASFQSRTTISLIEQFMETGFDKDITVKLINSILALNASDDYFSTIDLSVIDLNNGITEFVKIGAAPTYIKRNDRVEVVKTASLPAGILGNMEVELVKKTLSDGDMLIMLSDGILDAFENSGQEKERTFLKYVDEVRSINPQTVADKILDEAYKRSDSKPKDDMTVIVAKFWKKVSY
ncbi:MAG TPA: SpoIIE family protein phosphatase [Clostridiales bacterium]|nr:SpoIIE family protein phosphatase [Clostridiales bacterium]